MFNTINWDTLGDLLSDIVVIAILCVFLYIWAARVRLREMRERAEAERQAGPPAADEATHPLAPTPATPPDPRNDFPA